MHACVHATHKTVTWLAEYRLRQKAIKCSLAWHYGEDITLRATPPWHVFRISSGTGDGGWGVVAKQTCNNNNNVEYIIFFSEILNTLINETKPVYHHPNILSLLHPIYSMMLFPGEENPGSGGSDYEFCGFCRVESWFWENYRFSCVFELFSGSESRKMSHGQLGGGCIRFRLNVTSGCTGQIRQMTQ